jgi:hypothetical protein
VRADDVRIAESAMCAPVIYALFFLPLFATHRTQTHPMWHACNARAQAFAWSIFTKLTNAFSFMEYAFQTSDYCSSAGV